jgi:acetyl-CoA acyltransferase
MTHALIVDAVRTPVGRRNGSLSHIHPVTLAGFVLSALISRNDLDPAIVDDVVFGCVTQVGEQASNVGRNAWLAAGLPLSVPATTVTRACGSSQAAVHIAAALIQAGVCDLVIAGGVESMTRIPMGTAAKGPGSPYPPEMADLYDLVPQGISAQRMANKYGVGRLEMDELSARSHERAAEARRRGYLLGQLVAVPLPDGAALLHDEGVRPTTTVAVLSGLRPAFAEGDDITAGNASQISDGAAAVLMASPERAAQLGLRGRARVRAQATVGVDPVLMLEGPIPATAKVLSTAGLALSDIDLFEVNEAFASVVLAWQRATGADMEKVNVNGGAIAIGHPLGASGARLMCDLLYELERLSVTYGLETMCCAGGLGTATIIERLGN